MQGCNCKWLFQRPSRWCIHNEWVGPNVFALCYSLAIANDISSDVHIALFLSGWPVWRGGFLPECSFRGSWQQTGRYPDPGSPESLHLAVHWHLTEAGEQGHILRVRKKKPAESSVSLGHCPGCWWYDHDEPCTVDVCILSWEEHVWRNITGTAYR